MTIMTMDPTDGDQDTKNSSVKELCENGRPNPYEGPDFKSCITNAVNNVLEGRFEFYIINCVIYNDILFLNLATCLFKFSFIQLIAICKSLFCWINPTKIYNHKVIYNNYYYLHDTFCKLSKSCSNAKGF